MKICKYTFGILLIFMVLCALASAQEAVKKQPAGQKAAGKAAPVPEGRSPMADFQINTTIEDSPTPRLERFDRRSENSNCTI